MRHYFILNPAAGKRDRSPEFRQIIEAVCGGKGLDYEISVSQAPGHCKALAAQAAAKGEPCRIYACGGDGTLNEIVNGIVGFPNAAVTHFPGGSGNDFIKIFRDTAPFSDLERLLDPEEAEFDLIACGKDYALNICSIGLDARIGTDIGKYKRLPLVSGPGSYILSTLVNVAHKIHEHYVIDLDGAHFDGEKTLICVANGRHYGGSFYPVPEADPTDGLLDVLLVAPVNVFQVAGVIGKYKAGQYRKYPNLIHHYTCRSLTIRCDAPTPVNLDGELRLSREIQMSVAREKLRFFYPRGLAFK